jgi:hypothetical protein
MDSHKKPLKKDNETENHNKSVHEKWIERYEYFWSPEGQEEYNHTNVEWKVHVRKHREATGAFIDEPILDIRCPYQMDPNSPVAKAYGSHLCVQPQLQTEEQEDGRKMNAEETKTKMEANLAVARGNQIFFDHDPRRSMRMIGR